MAAVEGPELELFRNPEKYLNMLQDENQIVRRNGIKEIFTQIQNGLAKSAEEESKAAGDPGQVHLHFPDEVITPFIRPIILLAQDHLEKTRETAYNLLEILIHKLLPKKVKEFLPFLIPIMLARLGQPEINEPSEEVRLLAITRIRDLLQVLGKGMNPFIDDLLQILANAITDPYHKVRVLSCDVSCLAADTCRSVFHYNSDRLLRPLAMTIAHQHSRVRVHTVKCIHQVVLLGNHKGIEQILPYAIQRIFDPIPAVRLASVEAFGQWIMDFIDRYSYFPKLIPVLMAFQDDEDPRVQARARSLWEAAGQKYLGENLEKYRDEVDFAPEQPKNYPEGVIRPSIGCRLLMWHNVSAFIPALQQELIDWMPGTRIKAAQLIYFMILNTEQKITMHVDKILPLLSRSFSDTDPIVATYCMKAANLIGHFIPFNVTWPILTSTMSTGTTEGNLTTLFQVLTGMNKEDLESHSVELIKFFVDPDVLESHNAKRQRALIASVQFLLSSVPEVAAHGDCAVNVYRILLATWAQFQSHDTDVARIAIDGMVQFSNCRGQDMNELMGEYAGGTLEAMKDFSEWTTVSLDRLMFHVILSHGGLAVDRNMDTILKIMSTNLDPNKDPEVRLRFFQALSGHLMAYSKSTKVQKDLIQNFIVHIIEDVLSPNVKWAPGKTASVLRTSAMSCLLAIVNGGILDSNVVVSLSSKIVATVTGTAEDSVELTRFFSCALFQALAEKAGRGLPFSIINSIFEIMLKRMDDVSKRVRSQAVDSIHAIFKYIALNCELAEYNSFVVHVFNRLILHMDDTDEEIQQQIQGVLEDVGGLYPQLLVTECEKSKMKHRSSTRCESLISKFKNMAISASQTEDLIENDEIQTPDF